MSNGTGAVAGVVLDAGDAPLPRASVAVTGGARPVQDIGALTNDRGEFRLSNLPPGAYTVAAHSAGRPPGEAHVVIVAGETTRVVIRIHG